MGVGVEKISGRLEGLGGAQAEKCSRGIWVFMRGRYAKPRNRRTLVFEEAPRRRAPSLPAGDWDPRTRAWWKDVWRSPMAAEYLRCDVHGLYRLAVLLERFWRKPSASLAAEIRLESEAYGLTPTGRRRLRLQIQRAGPAGQNRPPAPAPPSDPRSILTFPKGDDDA